MIKIGVQGAPGSFTEQATHTFVERQKLTGIEIDYCISSEGVLSAVDNETVDYGVFAMENAQGGVVIESVKALAKYRCDILDMFYVMINQNLLTLPGVKASDITEIHSHQQALRQCRNFLADHFWSCPLVEEDDTAQAAMRLQTGELPATTAVIANRACAEMYGLEIFQENIHDLKNNLTLFIGISKMKRG